MTDRADLGSLVPAKRRQLAGRKSRLSRPRSSSSRVSLEKVLGISTVSGSSLTSDPNSGLIAYPAGCVIVLLHPINNNQSHIINTSKKPFTALAFSHDGKHLVSGESGHMPCVRVWEVGGGQVAEVQSHKFGVSCVAFSSSSCYVVSVGFQHDMIVSVWDWRKGSIIASNKVSSRVMSVSFSQDDSYFVTAGNRHVKFWFLDASKERRVNSTVPLIGRSGLLDEHKNSVFCGVACGRGPTASNTYCITSSGLLCLFNSSRHLEAWVNLKTSSASSLAVSEDLIFCGCANGLVRVFRPSDLQFVATLPQPHHLGVDVTQNAQHSLPPNGPRHPDVLALTFDPRSRHLSCVYSDHSVCVWDVRDVRSGRKLYSALYHSGCVWNVEMYPELSDPSQAHLPPSSFLTCSSDGTIRLWHADPPAGCHDTYGQNLLRIMYVGENTQHPQAEGERGEVAGADGKAGIRVLGISPDGQHLATGDRSGNLRIFGLQFLDELVKIEAHDSDVLCLEFSPPSTGVKLLASASRDRLVHIFNQERDYRLEHTLNNHSASITAVKFTGEGPEVRMVSCGADKSIYFQTAEQTVDGLTFSMRHHVVEKTALYDMDLDSSRTHVAIACQDRNVRVYDVRNGKLRKTLKGSSSDEGALLKVQMDPSGSFFATSCSDKNITIFDYESGECVATLFGHSEIVTCMRFSPDCRHLISVSGDSCVFVWRLDSHMTSTMRRRCGLSAPEARKQPNIRRETFITVPQPEEEEEEQEAADPRTPGGLDPAPVMPLLQTNGKLPMWFKKLAQGRASANVQSDAEPCQVRSRWVEQLDPLTLCSSFSPSPTRSAAEEEEEEEGEEDFQPQSMESLLGEEEELQEQEVLQTAGEDHSTFILLPNLSSASSDRDFRVEGAAEPRHAVARLEVRGQGAEPVWRTHLSPDSACFEGSTGSLEQQQDADTDSLSQGSSMGSLGPEDDDDTNSVKNHFETLACSLSEERFDTDLTALQPQEEKHFLNPRLSISTRFLSRFQDRVRAGPVRAPPPASIPSRISEESSRWVSPEPSEGSTQRKTSSDAGISLCALVRRQQPLPHRRTSCRSSRQPQQRLTRRRPSVLVIRCRTTLGDIPSRSSQATPLQQEASQLRYLENSISSSQENVLSSSCPAVPLLSSDPVPQVLATPPQVTSLGRSSRWSSSVDETPTIHNQSSTPSATPTTPSAVEGVGPNADPTDPDARPNSRSSPLSERPQPPQADDPTCGTDDDDDDDEESVSMQRCQQVANELRQVVRRAVLLYQQLGRSEQRLQNASVLQEAFGVVRSELQAVMQSDGGNVSAPSGQPQDDVMATLLEKYSDLLVQMTQNKLNGV